MRIKKSYARFTIATLIAGLASVPSFCQEPKTEKSTKIIVEGTDVGEIRQKVIEELEKAGVEAKVREKVLKLLDSGNKRLQLQESGVDKQVLDLRMNRSQKLNLKDGNESVEVIIGNPSDDSSSGSVPQMRARVLKDIADQKYRIGVACNPGVEDGAGLTVQSVTPDSPAAKADLKEGDLLKSVDGNELKTVEQLVKAVQKSGSENKELTFEILRGEEMKTVKVKPAEIKDLDRIAEDIELNMPQGGFWFDRNESLKDLQDMLGSRMGNRARSGAFAFSLGTEELKEEIAALRREIQELKVMIQELKDKK